MDINSMINQEPSQAQRQHPPPTPPQRGPSISRSTSDDYGPPHTQQHFPKPSSGYPPQPPPLDTRASSFSNSGPASAQQNTPVRTPQGQQNPHAQHYPFPSQYQSPVQTHHRSAEKFPSLTPTVRASPRSYSQSQDQRSPTMFAAPPPPPSHAVAQTHNSATPPSALRSPYGARGSPGSVHAFQQNPYGVAPHHSQPNTPLGPPSAQRPSMNTPREGTSPYAPHQRTHSATSGSGPRSIASNSPGPAVSTINNLLDASAAYGSALNQPKRGSTEFLQQAERHRSDSISPKSQISRRLDSIDSRRESHEQWPARSSLNQGRSEVDPRTGSLEQLPSGYPYPPSSFSRSSTGHLSQGAPSPLSQAHQIPLPTRNYPTDQLTRPSVVEQVQPQPQIQQMKRPSEDLTHTSDSETGNESLLQQPLSRAMMHAQAQPGDVSHVTAPLKRRADTMSQPEPKKPRTQHKEPPVWARLHPSNPGYETQIRKYPQLKELPVHDVRTADIAPHQSRASQFAALSAGSAASQANGAASIAPTGEFASRKAEISRKVGIPWELSITDQEVQNPLVISIGNFLYWQFAQRPELLGNDPRNGNLEIEAKIGTLLFNEGNSLRRLDLPVQTPTVLTESFSRQKVKFESMMDEAQNMSLNNHLNDLLKASMGIVDVPGVRSRDRVPLIYQHRYERDTFAPLSEYGLSQLSDFARNALVSSRPGATPRLRTTYDNSPKVATSGGPRPCLAQLVKIRLADLDIFCPTDTFDVRISVNIEVDFRAIPGVDPERLVDPAAEDPGKRKDPDRIKDRISYRHCFYQVDLTQVVTDGSAGGGGVEKKHELEVEVDGVALGRQVEALRQGRESAFGEVVEGLVNNVLLLARHQ